MAVKIIAPAALNALKDALWKIYWYKSDLTSFILNTVDDPAVLSRLNPDHSKRDTAFNLVDFYARNQNLYQDDLLRLIREVSRINDFSHLERLEDGAAKSAAAQIAVVALRKHSQGHERLIEEQKAAEDRRIATHKSTLVQAGTREKLEELHQEVTSMITSSDRQKRGYQLEKILRDLFALFDLDPKASSRNVGEQIDGAFSFEGSDYLIEAKWQEKLIGIQELDSFKGRLDRKL